MPALQYNRLESFGYLRGIDAEAMRITAVISTGDLARDDAIIDPAGWVLDDYQRNPVVLWGHDDGAMPLARTVDIQATPRELIAVAEFDRDDPDAVRLFRKVQNGFVNATSVRWLPLDAEFREVNGRSVLVFLRVVLLEWSLVSIPADPGAVVVRADGGRLDIAAIARELAPAPAPDPETTPADPARTDAPAAAVDAAGRSHAPAPEPDPLAARRYALVERVLAHAMRPPAEPDITALVVAAIARRTGRSEERVRAMLAGTTHQGE